MTKTSQRLAKGRAPAADFQHLDAPMPGSVEEFKEDFAHVQQVMRGEKPSVTDKPPVKPGSFADRVIKAGKKARRED